MRNLAPNSPAFTLVELLVIIAIIALFAATALPGLAGTKERSKRIACLNNLRQMGLGSQIYAAEDSQGRLTGTLQTTPAQQQADDDLNWLHGFGPGFRSYVTNLNVFVCPSTRNYIRPNAVNIVNYPVGSSQLLTVLIDLSNNAPNNLATNGHSYEVRGCWNDPAFTRKTSRSVLTYAHQRTPFLGLIAGPSQTFVIHDAVEPHVSQGVTYENWPNPFDCHGQDGANVVFADSHAEWIGKASWNYRWELSQDEGRQITPYN